jgi:predicted RND superfamily exporter protein
VSDRAMSKHQESHRILGPYARFVVKRPLVVLTLLLTLGVLAALAATRLTINSNQLDLISQDLPEVKEVKRVIDMVGGAGYLMLGVRSTDEKTLKGVADDLAAMIQADEEHVRFLTYKLPVEFVQENMVLFIRPEDLQEARTRINAYLKDRLRRSNPFFIELKKTKPLELDLHDLIERYNHVGKKSILDDYYISKDREMILLLIKPKWDSTEIGKTKAYLDKLNDDLKAYSKNNKYGVTLQEDYRHDLYKQDAKRLTYGYTGTYKTTVDDSYAIQNSLEPVTYLAFAAIIVITGLFFRKVAPSLIVISGMVLGTILTMGFTAITVHELNMVTSILGGILMGFGVDYGIHFIFRTRIELGAGKPYQQAIEDALVNAGRPAMISAVVTAGAFFMLLASQFRGFSQFGLLAGFGTLIIGVTLFSWSASILLLLGKGDPTRVERLIGSMPPPKRLPHGGELSVPRPGLVLGIASGVVVVLCACAIPWSSTEIPAGHTPNLWERVSHGVGFNYNTRALMAEDQYSVVMQDEVNRRFNISADPMAVYTKDLSDAREVWDELTLHPEKYSTIDQVVSIYTFVPPADRAQANVKILDAWRDDLKDMDVKSFPPDLQEKAAFFDKVLHAKPFDVNGVPDVYAKQFRNLPTAQNKGFLTFIYPSVDLWDGKKMLEFADQTHDIQTASGKVFHGAGPSILYAKLARMVLADGKITIFLTMLWVLVMHFADFRNTKLALASVIPLGVGLVVMLGMLSLLDKKLNFMNIIILPILLGFGVSHGLYLLHRFLEGTSPFVAFRSVGAAVSSSTLTAIAGFGSLFVASHNGLKSMGLVACLGLFTTLVVSFTVLAAVLQLIHNQRVKQGIPEDQAPANTGGGKDAAA